jgi:Fe-S cluster biogenesis protein NfuA
MECIMQQETQEQQRRAARIETLIQQIAALPDQRARFAAEGLVQELLGMYGEGLARLLELTMQSETAGLALIETFARDDLLSSLLLLHGLHPLTIEARIEQALERLRPGLRSHGSDVELLRVDNSVAYLRLRGSCHSCSSSVLTLKRMIEDAIYEAVPDLDDLRIEDGSGAMSRVAIPVTFVPLKRHKQTRPSNTVDGDE